MDIKLYLNKNFKKVFINEKEKSIPCDWDVASFSTFGCFKSGKDHKLIKDGNFPVYGSSKQIIRHVDQFLHSGNTFVIGRKGTIDSPYYSETPFWCVDTALYFDLNNKSANAKFLFYKTLFINWFNYNAGSTVPSLVQTTVNNIEFSTPDLIEQEWISNFLNLKQNHLDHLSEKKLLTENKVNQLQNKFLSGKIRVKLSEEKEQELLSKGVISLVEEKTEKEQFSFHNINEGKFEEFVSLVDLTKDIVFYQNDESNWKTEEVNELQKQLPKDWNVEQLYKKINFIKGKSIPENQLNYNGEGVKYLKTTEFWLDSSSKRDTVHYTGKVEEKYLKKKDEYVFSMDGFNNKIGQGTLGLISNEDEGIVSTSFYKLEKNDIYHLIVNVLKSNYVQNFIMRLGEGTTVYHAGKYLKNLQGIFPKSTVEQKLLSMIFEKEENLIDSIKEKIKLEEKVFKYLQQELLSGRIRIKVEE